MSINLLDMLKDQVTGSLAKQASGFLSESEENVTNGLGSIFPTLLGSVINKSSEPTGVSNLMDLIGGLDMDMLGDIGNIFGGGSDSVNGLLNSGGGIIESLLGDKLGGVVDLISKSSGLKSGSSSSLLKMAAPFLMGLIGKQIKGKGLSFLADLLMGQKEHVEASIPSGMGGLLGLSGFTNNMGGAISSIKDTLSETAGEALGTATDVVKGTSGMVTNAAGKAMSGANDLAKGVSSAAGDAANEAGKAVNTGLGWLKWALPILAILALLYWGFSSGVFGGKAKDAMGNVTDGVENVAEGVGDAASDAKDAVGDAANDAMGAVSEMAKAAFAKVDETAKAALDQISFAANSAGSQMMDFINGGFKGDGKVTFNNLTFETGSAQISKESEVEVDNIAAILKAYPDVKIDVSGYTDNQGDAQKNKDLSAARAMAVKARLMGQGIAADRVNTIGYGAENPIASNDSEEGRTKNRRIEVTIAK